MALRQRPKDEDVVEPIGERHGVEVRVPGRDRELEVHLVDDDDRLEAVGDRGDLGERHAVPGRVVRGAEPDEPGRALLGRGADLLRGLPLRRMRAGHRDDARAGQRGLDREHREGRGRHDDRVAGSDDGGGDEADQLIGTGARDDALGCDAGMLPDRRSQPAVAEVAVLHDGCGVPLPPRLAHGGQRPIAEGIHVVAHDRPGRQPGHRGELLVRGLQRVARDGPAEPQEPLGVVAHEPADGHRSANVAVGRRCSSWTDPPIACIEAWTR